MRDHLKVQLASLEADLAYFQARLVILGQPQTANQRAQRKAFRLLHKNLADSILEIRQGLAEDR